MTAEREFISSMYYHVHYGELAEIGLGNLRFSPLIEYNYDKGTPDLVIFSDLDLLCAEYKGHKSDSDISKNVADDADRFKKYCTILPQPSTSSKFCVDVRNIDISFCYNNDWIETLENQGISLEEDILHGNVGGVIWEIYKDGRDVIIQKKFGSHTISELGDVLSRGLRVNEMKIKNYTLLDWNESVLTFLQLLKLALYTLASQTKYEIDLEAVRQALESNNIIVSNNEQLNQRIRNRLNGDLSDRENRIVEKISDDKWKLDVIFSDPHSRAAWEKRWRNVLSKPQDDLSMVGM